MWQKSLKLINFNQLVHFYGLVLEMSYGIVYSQYYRFLEGIGQFCDSPWRYFHLPGVTRSLFRSKRIILRNKQRYRGNYDFNR